MSDPAGLDAQSTFSGVRPVDPGLELDLVALDAWMAQAVEGYAGPLSVHQFNGGQSNPTYALTTPSCAYVLRRKPSGVLLPSAHAVDREYRVIAALHAQGYPVPRPYALCLDQGVIGTIFYVMQKVEGRILWDLKLPGLTPDQRHAIYEAQVDALAELHTFDPATIGLSDFGKPGDYFQRQVDRWSRQYRASETAAIPAMNRLIDYLPHTTPAPGPVRVIHGDFRLDNMVLHPDRAEVAAVLDWELSTLGDPMSDLAGLLTAWVLPQDLRNGLGGLDVAAMGIPSVEAVIERYGARTGLTPSSLDWLYAYSLFRLAAICQGIAGRVRDGTAVSAHARAMAAQVAPLAGLALRFAEKT